MARLNVGDEAPHFRLSDADGKRRTLDLQSRLVLYFYPKDFTSDCTTQLKEFTQEYFYFRRKGFEVFGVSPDDQQSHKRFCEMHRAPYPLLSDLDGEVARIYGAWDEQKKGVLRSTFVIHGGVIRHAQYGVTAVQAHAKQLLDLIEPL